MNFRKTKYVNYLKSAFNVEIVYTHFKFLKDKFQFNYLVFLYENLDLFHLKNKSSIAYGEKKLFTFQWYSKIFFQLTV